MSGNGQTPPRHTWWYFVIILFLVLLSLPTANRTTDGEWTIALGTREATVFLTLLILLPLLPVFFPTLKEMTLKSPFAEFSIKQDLDRDVNSIQEAHLRYDRAGKNPQQDLSAAKREEQKADGRIEEKLATQGTSSIRQAYTLELYEQVRKFNRNRRLREAAQAATTKNEAIKKGDEIASKMRGLAPLVYGQLDVDGWLGSPNLGKRLAAIKYIDWAQDTEYALKLIDLLPQLEVEHDTFQAYHILLALYSMAGHLSFHLRVKPASLCLVPVRRACLRNNRLLRIGRL